MKIPKKDAFSKEQQITFGDDETSIIDFKGEFKPFTLV